jgi:hypothetical protein
MAQTQNQTGGGPGNRTPVVLKRQVRVDAAGTFEQTLTITPNEISKQTRGSRYYAETTIRRTRLSSYDIPAIHFIHGVESEGNNHWRSIMIIPSDQKQIDELLSRIKDFETFEAVAKCLHEICNRGGACGYRDAVICDLNICLTIMCDLKPCL